jgi:hypothetical protein
VGNHQEEPLLSTNQPHATSAESTRIVVRGLDEPLIAAKEYSARELEELREAIDTFKRYRPAVTYDGGAEVAALQRFVERNPDSAWNASIYLNLGLTYYRSGYFSRALESYDAAWNAGSLSANKDVRSLADRAVGELALLHARIGHSAEVEALIAQTRSRVLHPSFRDLLVQAGEGAYVMRTDPGTSFLCGPKALATVMRTSGAVVADGVEQARSPDNGYSLADLSALAASWPHRLVRRTPGSDIPVPSVVHWRVNHFAAIVDEREGVYRVVDPTFGTDLFVSRAALDEETSGHFLVPESHSGVGLVDLSRAEAAELRGICNRPT